MDLMESIFQTKVKIVIRKGEKPIAQLVTLGDLFTIDEANLSGEMAKQAALYAYFSTQVAYAEYSLARATAEKDAEYAEADEHYRRELAGEKYTEAVIRSMILQDEDFQKIQDNEDLLRENYKLQRAICSALEMRATMLQSLGAHLRHELDMTGMNIRDRRYKSVIEGVKKAVTDAREK